MMAAKTVSFRLTHLNKYAKSQVFEIHCFYNERQPEL